MGARYKTDARCVKCPCAAACVTHSRNESLSSDRCALARNENGARRVDIELSRVAPLIDRGAYPSSRIDIQKGLADLHVHECSDIRQRKRLLIDLQKDFVSETVAQLLELFA